jgi:polyisoprenoid-binding protein YceI
MRTLSFKATLSTAAAIALLAAVTTASTALADKVLPAAPPRFHYAIAPTGNEARYLVREELVGHEFPNDAIGITHGITGNLVFDTTGKAAEDSSLITIDVVQLKTDQDKRDKYIRENVMETAKYPTVTIVPSYVRGLTGIPPTSGSRPITFGGKLTVHGVTVPTIWHGSATFAGDEITGTMSTSFTFDDIKMKKPSRAIVLTVADTVKLEYDFHLIKK